MKPLIFISLFCALGTSLFACPNDPNALALIPEGNSPPAHISIAPQAISEPFDATVQICSELSFVALAFDATMPAHQHGMNYDVTVQKTAPGFFQIENIVFHMPGLWEIKIEAISGSIQHFYKAEVMVE